MPFVSSSSAFFISPSPIPPTPLARKLSSAHTRARERVRPHARSRNHLRYRFTTSSSTKFSSTSHRLSRSSPRTISDTHNHLSHTSVNTSSGVDEHHIVERNRLSPCRADTNHQPAGSEFFVALLATGSGPLTGSLWVASAITFPSPEGVGTCRFGNTPRTREALLTRPSPVTAADRSTASEALPSHCRRAPPTACRWTDKASCCTFSVVIFRQQRESFSLHQDNFSS
jgi:hypothetical protein